MRFKDAKKKRLSNLERWTLEVELYKKKLPKYTRELVSTLTPTEAIYVRTNVGGGYYVLLFGRFKLRCTERLYKLSPVKRVEKRTVGSNNPTENNTKAGVRAIFA